MILADVREALAKQVRDALGESLVVEAYQLDKVSPPTFTVGSLTNQQFNLTFGKTSGLAMAEFACRLFTSRTHDIARQKELEAWCSDEGDLSIASLLQADQTLGGAAFGVFVESMRAGLEFTVAGSSFYGAEFTVRVLG